MKKMVSLVTVVMVLLTMAVFPAGMEVSATAIGTVYGASTYAQSCLDIASGAKLGVDTDENTAVQGVAGPWSAELLFEGFDWKHGVYDWHKADIVYAKWWGYTALSQEDLFYWDYWHAGFPEHHRGNSVMMDPNTAGNFRLVPNSSDPQWGYSKVALSFEAPEDGLYEFAPETGLTQTFKNMGAVDGNAAAAAGRVRITVNNNKIWPADAAWFELAKGAETAIPNIQYSLREGDVLRVEAVGIEYGGTAQYLIAITASAQMTYLGDFVYLPGTVFGASGYAQDCINVATTAGLRDNDNDTAAVQSTANPWRAEILFNGFDWKYDLYDWQEADIIYSRWWGYYALSQNLLYFWGDWQSGFPEHHRANSVMLDPNAPGTFRLGPNNQDPQWGYSKVALSFTAPQDGLYEFAPESGFAQIFKDSGPIKGGATDNTITGVRITVNDTKIWPASTDWFALDNAGAAQISIPTLEQLMEKDDILRVEAVYISGTGTDECQVAVTASAQMTYLEPFTYEAEATPDTKAFTSAEYSYSPVTAQTFTVTNTGNQPLSGLTAALASGADFEITSILSAASLASEGTATVSVRPKSGLVSGAYSDTLQIRGNDGIVIDIAVSFTVMPKAFTPTETESLTEAFTEVLLRQKTVSQLSPGDQALLALCVEDSPATVDIADFLAMKERAAE